MHATHLRTEYLKNPLGIDIQKPRLFWNCTGGAKQTAFQVLARDEAGDILWDSGRVPSASMRTQYPHPLASRQRVCWQVRCWDENGAEGPWSEAAFFEMGLLAAADWGAQWITGGYRPNPARRYPVDCFKKCFTAGTVAKARLYITALGLYEAQLNGRRVGDFLMAPGHTDYRRRVQYQTYDVTQLVTGGENTLTVQLADGWYRGSCGAWGLRNCYGTVTKLLARLELTAADGTVRAIVTDGSWAWSADGPIRFADNKDGEAVDARMAPSYSGRARAARHAVAPTASNNVPVTAHERFAPAVIATPAGKTVLDFGQNIAGHLEFTLHAHAGQRVLLRFGEILDGAGEFTQHNIQLKSKHRTTPLQQVEYICKEGENRYRTAFAVFGFRYALLETDADWAPEDFAAVAVYSDLEQTGFFESSNPLLDKFFQNTVWSSKGNFLDVPTDCPTRERHAWTGDAQIFVDTAGWLFDYAAFARKYTGDMRDGQRLNGLFRQITPRGGVDFYMNTMDGSAGWSDAGVLIPYRIWKRYGDEAILRQNWPAMRRYALRKLRSLGRWYPTALPTGVGLRWAGHISNYGQSYGEWAEPADVCAFKIADFVSPHPEETTAYIVYMLRHMAEIAAALGYEKDAALFRRYADKARTGYRQLVKTKKFSLDTDRQAKLVRPLYMELLDEEQTAYAKRRLLTALQNYGWRLGTGFLSTPLILDVLLDIEPEAAFRLLENEDIPGWLAMPKAGATTVWENWEGNADQKGLGSMNHYSKGAVCAWLFERMCGIRLAGENHFAVAPHIGGHFTHAAAAYQSIYGRIESGWVHRDGKVCYTVTVPANCTAEIRLPGGTGCTVGAGTHTFEE